MSFTITLKPSGKTFEVPARERILTAAMDAGISLPHSCRRGTCLTCVAGLVEGQLDKQGGFIPAEMLAQNKILLCQAVPTTDLILDVEEAPPTFKAMTTKLLVVKMHQAAPDVLILTLRLPVACPINFQAGQYIELILDDGRRRSYSIATKPEVESNGEIELHIRHLQGGYFTDHAFGKLRERDVLLCEGPLGTFFLRTDTDKPIILLASGTGYAPIRSIIQTELAKRSDRKMALYWGCRTKQDLYSMEEAFALAAASTGRLSFVPVLSEPLPSDQWTGRAGFVHRAVMDDFSDLSQYQVYACGAPFMVDAARREFVAERHLPESEFFADAFLNEADQAALGQPAL